MYKYAFYTYSFQPGSSQMDLYEESIPFAERSVESCQSMLNNLFGEKSDEFQVQKNNKCDGEKYPCTVMGHSEGVVLLRIEHPKNVSVYVKQQSTKGNVAPIEKQKLPSNPYIYVIIDCRAGHNLMGISIDNDAWRNTDSVAVLIRESINRQFDLMARGINIVFVPQLLQRDFVEYSRFLIKKKKRRVTKMTFYFSGGTIDPKIEEIIKKDHYLSAINNKRFNAKHCEISYINPDSAKIIRKNSQVLEHFVALVLSEQQSDAFRLRMTYDDGTTLNCGKEVRMEYLMADETFYSFIMPETLFPENRIGRWLDKVAELIEEEQNGENAY